MEVRDSNNTFQRFSSPFAPISNDLRDEFYRRIAKENFTRIIIISIIYILFEIQVRLTEVNMHIDDRGKFLEFIIVFHVIAILISFWLGFKRKRTNGMITQIIIDLYCIILVYWAVTVSLKQVIRTGSITMFILTLTGTSALFYRRELVTLVTNFGIYIYFNLKIKLLEKASMMGELRNMPLRNHPPGSPTIDQFPRGHAPYSPSVPHPPAETLFNLQSVKNYIMDAFLMTMICCVIGIILYRLRLKVFLEQKTLEELALKDSMTNLFNHKTICDSLIQEIKRSKRNLQPVSILMTDIDHFKNINDTYGHQVGDQVIIKISKLLTEICRETDYVGRYGGEEFLIVLTNTNKDDAMKFSERLRSEVEKMDFGLSSRVTISGGVRTYEKESAEEMIKLADGALYQAKEKGRNRIVSA
ncbi:GGDEF domain-containing protein [Wukongibacter baidiensis]|uniref:GGDEF domain-containing protein n=1 Tax=Wukongibacter baidiensis TaxID=1723361 RepID=UPI003D7FD574